MSSTTEDRRTWAELSALQRDSLLAVLALDRHGDLPTLTAVEEELAESHDVSRTGIWRALQVLHRADLVNDESHPDFERRPVYRPTEAGRRMVEAKIDTDAHRVGLEVVR